MRKVLMPIGDGSEVLDTLYPYFRLPEDGFEVVVAGPEARIYHLVMQEIPPRESGQLPWDIVREQPGYHLRAQVAFRDLDPTQFLALFLSGGRAPEYLRYDRDLIRITQHFFEADKPVAAICHGVEILAAAGCLRGRTATTVPKCALDVKYGGGNYIDEPCVIDGNLVTGRTYQDNTPLLKAFVLMLKGYNLADANERPTVEEASVLPSLEKEVSPSTN